MPAVFVFAEWVGCPVFLLSENSGAGVKLVRSAHKLDEMAEEVIIQMIRHFLFH